MIRWAAGRPAVVWAFAFALLLAGAVSLTRLPLATKTQIELPQLRVQAAWPGASAELLEAYVTSPLEAAIQPVRGVRKLSSESGDRGSQITVDLDPGVNVGMVRLAILERLELLRPEFPIGVFPAVSNYVPEDLSEPVLLTYTVSGPYTPGSLSKIADEEVIPRLATVPGVAGVSSFGIAETGIAVIYDPVRLRQVGVRPEALSAALGDARKVEGLGNDHTGTLVRPVVLRDQPRVMEDLARLPVRGMAGRVFALGELAEIRQDEDTRGRFNRFDGRSAVTMRVSRLAGADAIRTVALVERAIADLQSVLPPGIQFTKRTDDSVELARELRDLAIRGTVAFFTVLLVLSVMLRNARSVLLVMGSAGVAIAGTALTLYLLEIPANLLTLAGLGMGVGILVQNGLIVVERLRGVPDTPDARAAAGNRIMPAIAGSTLTTAVVLFPFLYLQGNARAAFVPFAAAFAVALAWSVVASVVMIPAVGTGPTTVRKGRTRFLRVHQWVLRKVLRWRWAVIGLTTAALGVLGWGFATRVERISFGGWGGQRTTLSVSLSFPRGSDPESLDLAMREFESIAVGREGVERVETQSTGIAGARMVVTFRDEYQYGPIPAIMQDEMTQRAVLVGGATVSVQGQGPGFYSGGGGGSVSFRIKTLGYSYSGVERMAIDLGRRLEAIPRVRTVNVNAGTMWGQDRAISVVMEPDRPALARAGVTAAQFAAAVQREVRGTGGGIRLELEGEEVVITVKSRGARERALGDLQQTIVPNPNNAPVRLADLSTVEEREGLSTISREDQQYVRYITYDFRGPSRLAQRTHDAFMASISVPPGYAVEDARYSWGIDESGKGLWLVFALGLMLVVLGVALVFDSAWAAAMVFLSLPIAISGVAAIFWATDTSFGREAAVGLILVIGLAVNQTILLVDAALSRRLLREPDGRRTIRPLRATDVLHAARDRSSMIVLVTLVTLASLLPLALRTDLDSLFGAIALATVGGTLAGTLGALVIVPALLPALRRQGPTRRGPKGPRRWRWRLWPRRGAQ